MRNVFKILVGRLKETHRFGDLSIGGKVILTWILRTRVRNCGLASLRHRVQWLVIVDTAMNIRVP
jgi:hypothetical protein